MMKALRFQQAKPQQMLWPQQQRLISAAAASAAKKPAVSTPREVEKHHTAPSSASREPAKNLASFKKWREVEEEAYKKAEESESVQNHEGPKKRAVEEL